MTPIFVNTIVFVKDLECAKTFYTDVLGQKILEDFGTITFFENHLVLHQAQSITKTVFKKESSEAAREQGKRNLLIYFESDEMENMFARVSESGAQIIHGIERQAWGQTVFRFFDPDGHIVEIGEPMHTKTE